MTRPYEDMVTSCTEMALRLTSQPDQSATLDAIVTEALDAIDGAEHASLTVRRSAQGRYRTIAATSDLAERLDALQFEAQAGPCLDALTRQPRYVADDLANDARWPTFAQRAADQTPVSSVLTQRLQVDEEDSIATLNLYSTAPAAFAAVDEVQLNSLVTLSAIAMAKAEAEAKRDNLAVALQSNRRIGAAVGVLMVTYKIQYDEAFTYLRVASQHRHAKLTVVADEVLETGELHLPV